MAKKLYPTRMLRLELSDETIDELRVVATKLDLVTTAGPFAHMGNITGMLRGIANGAFAVVPVEKPVQQELPLAEAPDDETPGAR